MIDQSKVEAFVHKKPEYYVQSWQSLSDGNGSRLSFNWSAFLVSACWLVYRKMYREFFLLVLAITIVAALTGYVESLSIVPAAAIAAWDIISVLIYAAIVASFGNYWYLRRFQISDKQLSETSGSTEEHLKLLEAGGGTNPIGALAVASTAILLIIVAPFIFAPELVGKGNHNLLTAITLALSIVFGILLGVRAAGDSNYKWITIPVFSAVITLGLVLASAIIVKPVQHQWYSWAARQFGERNPYVLAMRELEPAVYRQYEENVIAEAKRERLDLRGIVGVAVEQSRAVIVPKALEYFSNSTDSSTLRIADSHLILLSEVANQYPDACANNNLGFQYNQVTANAALSEVTADFRNMIISAIKSGLGRDANQEEPVRELFEALQRFVAEHPEYAWILNSTGDADRQSGSIENRVHCEGRLELVEFMRQQPDRVAASYFRKIYR